MYGPNLTGGKVINRSQSGSWQHHCMGAGLRHNMGDQWSLQAWKEMTNSSPNKVFTGTTENSAVTLNKDRKRKATTEAKESRRSKLDDNSATARRAYCRHDDGISPEEVIDDVSPEHLEELKSTFFQTKVVVTRETARELEYLTRNQVDSDQSKIEQRKRITASNVGGIAKMRTKTKRSKKVHELLYSTFKGNKATIYGLEKEATARQDYITHQQQNNHPNLSVQDWNIHISRQ